MHPRRRASRTAALALVALTLTTAGCGLGGPPPAAEGEQGGSNQLTVWFPGTNASEIELVTETIVPRFEAETGAEVEVTFLDWPDMSTKLNAAFAAGTAPDVFGHGPAAVADFVANDRLTDLGPFLDQLELADREDMAAALPGGQVDGTQYLLPLSLQGSLLAYDADAFTEAGLDPDQPPATWQEARELAGQLTERDGGEITRSGLLLPSHPIGLQQSFATLLYAAGGTQVSEDGSSATFASSEGAEVLDFITGTYTGDDAVATGLGMDYSAVPPAQQPLVTGDAAMMVATAPQLAQMKKADPDADLRVAPAMSFDGSTDPAAFGGAGPGLMINADSPEQELAWQLLEYLISPEVGVEYTEGIGAIPVRASATGSDYVQGSDTLQTYLDSAPAMVPNPNVAGWVQVRDTMAQYLEQATNEKLPADEALSQAAAEVDGILQKAG
ncbi:ABC transporter substrate-binding protein [Auraticoccus monumenti]|uniref:Carbohydrate ABC transporter substrate-binding protein, CUT1 family n=1 Tax=Auraticoccus monumenti TaxID=675864 RepID=A0A1G7D193_9ACTN|nr:ABC transporter substrate-binding protein [Auraticoccus monumenti]SDE45297.1 carbohydrate ABC transporter substrate-binding protein, CUT1 family [Auraticoccus monumenti]